MASANQRSTGAGRRGTSRSGSRERSGGGNVSGGRARKGSPISGGGGAAALGEGPGQGAGQGSPGRGNQTGPGRGEDATKNPQRRQSRTQRGGQVAPHATPKRTKGKKVGRAGKGTSTEDQSS